MGIVTNRSTVSPNNPGSRLAFYLMGEEGILFSKANGTVYRLNTSAAFIWCCCEEGFAPLAIAGMLSKRFGIPRTRARQDVMQAFAEWREAGLLAGDQFVAQQDNPAAPLSGSLDSPARRDLPATPYQYFYRLFDTGIQMRYPGKVIQEHVHPIFKHLEAHPDTYSNIAEKIIDIVQNASGYSVFINGKSDGRAVSLPELAPILQREVLLASYEHTDCLAALHAAAVCSRQDQCIVLPAMSGSGKSTLAAALLSAGLTYLTDELILLTADEYAIRPAYVSLAIKRDSWPILADKFPLLKTLPPHLQDGVTEVKYLSPPKGIRLEEKYHSSCLVFPKYRASAPTMLTALAPAEALYRIAEAGYDVPGRLTKQCLKALIHWVEQLPSYELQIGELDEAVCKIQELLA